MIQISEITTITTDLSPTSLIKDNIINEIAAS